MWSFVAFLAVVAAVAGAIAGIGRYPVVGRAVAFVVTALAWPLLTLCRLASAAVDLFLPPRGSRRRVSLMRYAIWAAVALLPMAAFFATMTLLLPPSILADPGYLLVLGALFNVFVVAAAYLIVHDDFDVMDGVIDNAGRRIGGIRSATRPAAIAISVMLVAAYAIAVIYWLSAVEGFVLFDKQPQTGFAALDYVLIGLRALPTDWLLGLLDRLTGDDTSAVFNGTLVAQGYYFTVKGIGSLLLVGLVTIAIQETWQLRRIVTALGDSDERRNALMQRAALAPPVIRSGILRAAVTPSTIERQKRLIVVAKDIGIFTLPQTFCHYVESFDPEIQVFGLDQCLEMYRNRLREFDADLSDRTLIKAAHVLRRGRLDVEPTKKVLRLMTSIVVNQRGALPDSVRGMIFATVKKELDKPRAEEDPALRGFFRDLQSAMNVSRGPAAAKPATAKKPAEPKPSVAKPKAQPPKEILLKNLPAVVDPVSPPESPGPTVH